MFLCRLIVKNFDVLKVLYFFPVPDVMPWHIHCNHLNALQMVSELILDLIKSLCDGLLHFRKHGWQFLSFISADVQPCFRPRLADKCKALIEVASGSELLLCQTYRDFCQTRSSVPPLVAASSLYPDSPFCFSWRASAPL